MFALSHDLYHFFDQWSNENVAIQDDRYVMARYNSILGLQLQSVFSLLDIWPMPECFDKYDLKELTLHVSKPNCFLILGNYTFVFHEMYLKKLSLRAHSAPVSTSLNVWLLFTPQSTQDQVDKP